MLAIEFQHQTLQHSKIAAISSPLSIVNAAISNVFSVTLNIFLKHTR